MVAQGLKDLMDLAPFNATTLYAVAPDLAGRLNQDGAGRDQDQALDNLWRTFDLVARQVNHKDRLHLLAAQAALGATDFNPAVTARLAKVYFEQNPSGRADGELSAARSARRWAYKGFDLVAEYLASTLVQKVGSVGVTVWVEGDRSISLGFTFKGDADMDDMRVYTWDEADAEDACLVEIVRSDIPTLSGGLRIDPRSMSDRRIVHLHWTGEVMPLYVLTTGALDCGGSVTYSVIGKNAMIAWQSEGPGASVPLDHSDV